MRAPTQTDIPPMTEDQVLYVALWRVVYLLKCGT